MPDDEQEKLNKVPVFKNKVEQKKEVNRLRMIKRERRMKLLDRVDDVVPSPGQQSISIESFCHEPELSDLENSTDGYLDALLAESSDTESPQNIGECGGAAALVGIVLTLFAALYFKK